MTLTDARHLELINYGMGYVPTEAAIVNHPAVAALHRSRTIEWPPTCPECKRSLGSNCAPGCRERVAL